MCFIMSHRQLNQKQGKDGGKPIEILEILTLLDLVKYSIIICKYLLSPCR